MYKLCKTEQATKRQRWLELGLLQLMLRKNYDEITISELCDELEVPRKSFYRYFASKDGALFSLIDHTLMEFDHILPQAESLDSRTAKGDLCRYFQFWYDRRELLEALRRSQLSGILVERSIRWAIREKRLPGWIAELPQQTQSIAINFAVCGLLSMVLQWHAEHFRISAAEMSAIATRMLSQPLLPPRTSVFQ